MTPPTLALAAWLLAPPAPAPDRVETVEGVVRDRAAGLRRRLPPGRARAIARAVVAAALRNDVPEEVVLATVEVESGYDVDAVSPRGCRGLLQLAEGTAEEVARRLGLRRWSIQGVADNVALGTAYLAWLRDRYGRWDHVLTAYDAGPGRFERTRRTSSYARRVLGVVGAIAGRLKTPLTVGRGWD